MEARYCDILHLEMRSLDNKRKPPHERITEIETHRTALLPAGIKWRVDFTLTFADGHREWREVKGMADGEYRLKRKLFDEFHPDKPVRVFTLRGNWKEI